MKSPKLRMLGLLISLLSIYTSASSQTKSDSNHKQQARLLSDNELRLMNADPGIRYMAMQQKDTVVQPVSFSNSTAHTVGRLHLPAGFDKNKKYPVVLVGEQSAEVHLQKLAEAGYIVLMLGNSW